MAYSDFVFPSLLEDFEMTRTGAALFAHVPPVEPSPMLVESLRIGTRLASGAGTESARATWIVGPVLLDLWNRYGGRVGLYAGAELYADPAAGLTGYCDFLITRSAQVPVAFGPPAVVLVEAKRDSIEKGLGQCVASMIGAERVNRRAKQVVDPIYGCVTTGNVWKFLQLSGKVVTVDFDEYGIAEVPKILGILTHLIGAIP
jgi:hypothetical protein